MDRYSIFEYLPKIFRRLRFREFALPQISNRKSINTNAAEALEYCLSIQPDNGKSAIRETCSISTDEFDLQIIVPVYNTEKYISGCIESVLRQKTDLRYILSIINDGSTDHSLEIIRKYREDQRVEIITQPNKGFSGARNAGLERMKGRYIMFLDSDDELADGCLQAIYKSFDKNADVIGGDYLTIDIYGNVIQQVAIEGNLQSSYPWGKAFKSELFRKIVFPEGYWFEDSIMGFLIFPIAGKMINTHYPIYRYRINPSGITLKSRGNPKMLDTVYITLRVIKDRAILGLDNNMDFYETLLYQIQMNQIRLSTLGDRRIQQAAFHIMREAIIKCGLRARGKHLRMVEKAVFDNDFPRFLWTCNW